MRAIVRIVWSSALVNTTNSKDRAAFAAETARRIQAFSSPLHGLACVDCLALADGGISLRVEYFADDVSREACGDMDRLTSFLADMGLIARTESPADGGHGAFGCVEVYTLD